VTVIVRLLLDKDGKLMYGDLVDMQGVVRNRFNSWAALTRTVRDSVLAATREGDFSW